MKVALGAMKKLLLIRNACSKIISSVSDEAVDVSKEKYTLSLKTRHDSITERDN